jgi:hypothetical protein
MGMDAPLGALRGEDEDVRVSVLEMDGVGVVEREEIAEEGELLELAIVELAPGKERVELDRSGIVMRIVSGVMLVSDVEYEEHKASFAEYALDKSDVLQAATRQFEKAVRKAGTVVRHAQPTSV